MKMEKILPPDFLKFAFFDSTLFRIIVLKVLKHQIINFVEFFSTYCKKCSPVHFPDFFF